MINKIKVLLGGIDFDINTYYPKLGNAYFTKWMQKSVRNSGICKVVTNLWKFSQITQWNKYFIVFLPY